MDRVIHVGKKFTLGFCACGCGIEIELRSKHDGSLRHYERGHHKGNLGRKKYCLLNFTKLCECGCGETIPMYYTYNNVKGTVRKFKHGHYKPFGEINPMWKGGRYLKDDYFVIRKNSKRVLEHRWIYEQYHKCCMLSWGIVHHKNENKTDNRIDNLEGMILPAHIKLHNPKQVFDRRCYFCGSDKTYYDKKRNVYKWHFYNHDKEKPMCLKCRDYRRYHGLNL